MPENVALEPGLEKSSEAGYPPEDCLALVQVLNKMLALHSPTAGAHTVRVSTAAEFISIQMSMTLGEVADIRTGALLHDIGKVSVPQTILQKDQSQLNGAEKALLKQHPSVGAGLLDNIGSLDTVRRIIRHHHESFDGTGWPDRISGDDIPIGSRIIAVVDMYDKILYLPSASSMGAKRDFAITHLKNNSGRLFDPGIVEMFLEFLDVQDMVDSQIMEVPVPLRSLKEGMVLAQDLYTSDNTLVLPKDTKLGAAELERIASLSDASPVTKPATVYVE